MIIYKPDYYDDFKCILGDCRHNCCIGWEIDIDKETYEYYNSLGGEFGEKLKANITDGDEPHFILSDNDRCPFLNDKNLCDIILKIGEDKLCQICNDHPRFRNFFESRTEIGLGLCCEAAGRLILSQKNKVTVIADDLEAEADDREKLFFSFRNRVFDIIQDRDFSIIERMNNLLIACGIDFEFKLNDWIDKYLGLERLDEDWTKILTELKDAGSYQISSEWDICFEQLMVYFIYRHLSEGIYDNMIRERILFCVLSFYMVYSICSVYSELNFEILVEIARMYSQEIEYSEDNINSLFGFLSK